MAVSVRRAQREDIPALLSLIEALADYERLDPPDAAAQERLQRDGWPEETDAPRFQAWLAEISEEEGRDGREEGRGERSIPDPQSSIEIPKSKIENPGVQSKIQNPKSKIEMAVGYAITFYTYSSFLARPTLYIEDIFVLPDFRRQAVGSALMEQLIQEAKSTGCGRIEWVVLDWNTGAQTFYQRLGASHLTDWQYYRLLLEQS